MKKFKISIVISLILVMPLFMANIAFSDVNDYVTLQWDVVNNDLRNNPNLDGSIKITLTGVVGEKIDDAHVKFPSSPEAYYYSGHQQNITVPRYGDSIQNIIDYEKKAGVREVSIKLIPVVEGSTITISLGTAPYFQYQMYWDMAFSETNPILTRRRQGKTFFYQMWTGDAPQSYTFTKTSNSAGTFPVYQFPNEYNDLGDNIAFYVVTEEEAKALMANTNLFSNAVIKATSFDSTVQVDGKKNSFEAYHIDGSAYFKLQDIAKVVSSSDKNFSIVYNTVTNSIELTSGKAYTEMGGELSKGDGQEKIVTVATPIIYVDGVKTAFKAYHIDGNIYFKLRDVARAFNIGIGWDDTTKTVIIDTKTDYDVTGDDTASEVEYVRVEAEDYDVLDGHLMVEPIRDIGGGYGLSNFEWGGDSITFVDCPPATALRFRYANNRYIRNVKVYIDGKIIDSTLAFANTHGYDDYQEATFHIEIKEGADLMIKLGSNGALNIDHIDFINENQ